MGREPVSLVTRICLVICSELQNGSTSQAQHHNCLSLPLVVSSTACQCQTDLVL